MEKFINLCKKQLIWIFSGLFLAFMIILIVVSCLPHGRKYVGEMSGMGQNISFEYVLNDNSSLEMNAYLNGEKYDIPGMPEDTKINYKIEDGKLFVISGESTQEVGKINAYEISIKQQGTSVSLVCKTNVTLRTISIVFMSVFGVATIICIVLLVLFKKGIIKSKNTKA